MVAPCRGDDILSASENWLHVHSQSCFMLSDTLFETLIQYSVASSATSGYSVESYLATRYTTRKSREEKVTMKDRMLDSMFAVEERWEPGEFIRGRIISGISRGNERLCLLALIATLFAKPQLTTAVQ